MLENAGGLSGMMQLRNLLTFPKHPGSDANSSAPAQIPSGYTDSCEIPTKIDNPHLSTR